MGPRLWAALAGLALCIAIPVFAEDKVPTCAGPQDACQQNVQVWKSFDAAYNKQDAAGTAAVFTQDAVWVLPWATLSGKQAIEKQISDNLKAKFSNAVSTVDEVHVAGDSAWVVGHWTIVGVDPNNAPQPVQGRWGSVHVREGVGGWKVRMSTVNVPLPPDRP